MGTRVPSKTLGRAGATGGAGAGGPKPGGSSDPGPSCPSAGIAAAITATAKASVRLETQFFIRDRLFHRLGLNFGIHEGKRRKDAHDDHEDKYQKDRCTRHLRPQSNWMRTAFARQDRKSTRLNSSH